MKQYHTHLSTIKNYFCSMKTNILSLFLLIWLTTATIAVGQTTQLRTQHFTTRDGLASNVVNTAMQDHLGYIWLGTSQGLTRYDGYQFVNFYYEADSVRLMENVTLIVEDKEEKRLLVRGNDNKTLCFDLVHMRFTSTEGVQMPKISQKGNEEHVQQRVQELGIQTGNMTGRRQSFDYEKTNEGVEIFTTIDNGLFVYFPDSKELQHYSATDEHPIIHTNNLNSVLKDRTGCIWITTTYAGIYQLIIDDKKMSHHLLKENTASFQQNSIRSFSQLPNKEVVISNMEGDVYRYNPETNQKTLLMHKEQRVYTTCTDAKGRFWVGTRGGGLWLDNKNQNEAEGLRPRMIYDLCFDAEGTLWIATLDGGLVEAKEGKDGHFIFSTHLKDEKVHELDIDPKGRLWIATERGIFMMEKRRPRPIYQQGKVVCITHTADGTIYAGTIGLGLMAIDMQGNRPKLSFITTAEGLANNNVKALVEGHQNIIVAATDEGISLVDRLSIRNLYSSQGMMADVYNENAAIKMNNGHVLLGNLTGWVDLDPSVIKTHPLTNPIPPVQITCISINEQPLYQNAYPSLSLENGQNSLCITYSSLSYKYQQSIIYSYWMEGFDNDWRPSTQEIRATYNNLPPGHYRFHVRASLPDYIGNEETVCDIYIAHPWWWSWWMRTLYVLLILLLIGWKWKQYRKR